MLKQELDRFRKVWAAVVGACMVSAALLASSLSAGIVKPVTSLITVSYTHLDVYKRQVL